MTDRPLLTLGTRGSPLALVQAEMTRAGLAAAHPALAAPGALAVKVVKTSGDRIQDRRLAELGGKGLFVKELELALLDGEIDVAVHSMKDVPTWLPEGLLLGAVLPRADVRDALIGPGLAALDDLPPGAKVGTCSLRRQFQVLARRPDLEVLPIRGNVETRLAKVAGGEMAATFLAKAGLDRLGKSEVIAAVLEPEVMLPAVAQGAVGLELRAADARAAGWIAALDDPATHARVRAERACLDRLGGSCTTPVGVLAEWDGAARLRLRAVLGPPDGSRLVAVEERGGADDPEALGQELGARLRGAAGPELLAALGCT